MKHLKLFEDFSPGKYAANAAVRAGETASGATGATGGTKIMKKPELTPSKEDYELAKASTRDQNPETIKKKALEYAQIDAELMDPDQWVWDAPSTWYGINTAYWEADFGGRGSGWTAWHIAAHKMGCNNITTVSTENASIARNISEALANTKYINWQSVFGAGGVTKLDLGGTNEELLEKACKQIKSQADLCQVAWYFYKNDPYEKKKYQKRKNKGNTEQMLKNDALYVLVNALKGDITQGSELWNFITPEFMKTEQYQFNYWYYKDKDGNYYTKNQEKYKGRTSKGSNERF